MGTPINHELALEISRLMKLLRSPIRVRLLDALAIDGPASPTTLSGRFEDLTLGDCNYHCRQLEKGGLARIVDSRRVRGGNEQIYGVEPRSRWPFSPRLWSVLSYLFPTMTGPQDPYLNYWRLNLDDKGVADTIAATEAARAGAARIAAEAQQRLENSDPANAIRAVLTMGLLDWDEFEDALYGGTGNALKILPKPALPVTLK